MSVPTPTPQPMHCRVEAYDYLADQLQNIDCTQNLLRAAIAVSMHELDNVVPTEIESELLQLTNKIAARLNSSHHRAIIAHAHEVLFVEERFKGCRHDYHNPKHSYIPYVVRSRRGLPNTLSLVYKYIIEQLGLQVEGIGVPGHFITQVTVAEIDNAPPSIQLIDPFFSGRMMTGNEVTRRAAKMTGQTFAVNDIFRPVTNQQWLRRIILNLIKSFDQRGRTEDYNAMHEMLALVESI
ncbi:transglutaminase family protein [Planctomycetota bacterium]|nr:transglutaminase family protein [Planctomycetota bacterium]